MEVINRYLQKISPNKTKQNNNNHLFIILKNKDFFNIKSLTFEKMFDSTLDEYLKLGQATTSQSIAPSTLSQVLFKIWRKNLPHSNFNLY